MRAKFIYEKFKEYSDPISDMGIGIIKDIKQWIFDNTGYEYDKLDPEKIFSYCLSANKYQFAEYLLNKKLVDINSGNYYRYGHFLKDASFNTKWNLCKFLLDHGANLEKTINHTSKKLTPITYRRLIELKRLVETNKL